MIMVTHKSLHCKKTWRSEKLNLLTDIFSIDNASDVGLTVYDLQKLRHQGFIHHYSIKTDTGYWEKYKICSIDNIRKKKK